MILIFLTVEICFATMYTKRNWGDSMNFILNPVNIDIVIAIILIVMLIFGYIKGFIYSVYGLLATLVSLFLALYLSSPIAALFKVYQVSGLGEQVGEVINRFLIFVILFIVIKAIVALIGLVIKPLIKGIIDRISIFKTIDGILGALFKLIEGIILIYIALIFIITPIVPGGKESVDNTLLASRILRLVPSLSEEMSAVTDGVVVFDDFFDQGLQNNSYDPTTMNSVITMLSSAYDYGLVSQENMVEMLYRYYDPIESPVVVDNELYQQTVSLLNQINEVSFDQNRVLSKIIVSE